MKPPWPPFLASPAAPAGTATNGEVLAADGHRAAADPGDAHDVGRGGHALEIAFVVAALTGELADFLQRAGVDQAAHAFANGLAALVVVLGHGGIAAELFGFASTEGEFVCLGYPVDRDFDFAHQFNSMVATNECSSSPRKRAAQAAKFRGTARRGPSVLVLAGAAVTTLDSRVRGNDDVVSGQRVPHIRSVHHCASEKVRRTTQLCNSLNRCIRSFIPAQAGTQCRCLRGNDEGEGNACRIYVAFTTVLLKKVRRGSRNFATRSTDA